MNHSWFSLAAALVVLGGCSSSPPPPPVAMSAASGDAKLKPRARPAEPPPASALAAEPAPAALPAAEPAPASPPPSASTLGETPAPTFVPSPLVRRFPGLAKSFSKPKPLPAWHHPAFDKSQDELLQMIAESTKDYTKEGAPIEGRLEAFTPVTLHFKRGTCYRMVFRLKDGAAFSEWAKRGVSFNYLKSNGAVISGGPGIAGRGGVGSAGCMSTDTTVVFDVQAIWLSALDLSHLHDLGHGGFTAQLYSKQRSGGARGAR